MLTKNTGSQKVRVFAFDATTNLPKTGDAANITASVSKDFGAFADLADTSATEEDSTKAKGYYLFDVSQTECNADDLAVAGRSTTANVVVVGAPARMRTVSPTYASDVAGVLGSLSAAASSGDPGTTTTLAQYLKQVVNTLEGTAGLPAFPAAAAAGNGISLAEVIRGIEARLPAALDAGGFMKSDVEDWKGAAAPGMTGDAFARLGAPAGASVSADVAANLAAVLNVQNNTFVATSIPPTLERPDAGSATVSISIVFSDETGSPKNLDSGNPAVALVNDAGADLSSRLGAFTNPSTGKYVVPYTSSAGDAVEGLHWDVTGTVNGKLRRVVAYTQVVDTTAVSFTSADRTKLTRLDTDYTTARAGKVDNLDAAVTTRLAAATYAAPDNAGIAGTKAQTDKLTFDGSNRLSSNLKAVNDDASAAANLAKTARAIGRGTVGAGATTTSVPTSAFSPAGSASDQFKDAVILFDADTATAALRSQRGTVSASTAAANPTFTVSALTTAPAIGDVFSVV